MVEMVGMARGRVRLGTNARGDDVRHPELMEETATAWVYRLLDRAEREWRVQIWGHVDPAGNAPAHFHWRGWDASGKALETGTNGTHLTQEAALSDAAASIARSLDEDAG